jgi:3-oxoacyl-[acyl-carrier-protein] synthase II
LNRVVITGLGAVTPLGNSVAEFWEGLSAGRNGIGPITSFDTTGYPATLAAEVRGFDPEDYMDGKRVDRSGRCTHFAIAASGMALADSGLDMAREISTRVGVVIATSGMSALLTETGVRLKERGPRRIDPLMIHKVGPNMVPVQVGLELGARGRNLSLNSACASGTDALGTALAHLQLGHADVIFAGGAEAIIQPISIASTGMVGALTKATDPALGSRPFDLNRNGFVYGEGAGMLVLETEAHALARGAHIYAELAGAGWSFDGFNETAPDAELQAVAMRMALDEAGVPPEAVDYVNAHGTSTVLNDLEETRAIKITLGDHAYKIPISSNKSMIGHIACAAGSVEAVAAVKTIETGLVPPTINYVTPDPACDLDYVPNRARQHRVDVCLSNSFGMGGQNACVVLRRYA